MTTIQANAPSVVCIGETMALFRASQVGPLIHSRGYELAIGGAESNVAVALRRLGVDVVWAGRLGGDTLGDLIVHELRGEGVLVHAARDRDAPTGMMLKERRTDDLTRVTYYRRDSAGSRLSVSDLPLDLIAGAQILHVTGITPALSASAREAVIEAVRFARGAGTLVSFDVNFRRTLWDVDAASSTLPELIANTDILFAGTEEARILGADGEPAQLMSSLADLGPQQVLIKLGKDGCAARIDGKEFGRAAVPIRPVDTVGAGDAFAAGYLAELLADAPPELRLDTANRCGAFACLAPGDWEGLPTRSELSALDAEEGVVR